MFTTVSQSLFNFVFSEVGGYTHCGVELVVSGYLLSVLCWGVGGSCPICCTGKHIAASLCSSGWQESLGMILSGKVGFVYMSMEKLFCSLWMVRSRKMILRCASFLG